MAKLILLLLCAVVALQLTASLRVKRETVKTEETQKTIENALDQVQSYIKNTFSQDQLEKFGNEFKEFSEKMAAKGKELLQEADANIKKITTKD